MSGENNGDAPNPSTVVKLEIFYDTQSGQLGMTGPVDNPVLAFGLLDWALETIRTRVQSRTVSPGNRIVPAATLPFPRV